VSKPLRRLAVGGVLVLVGVLAGCSGDEGDSEGAGTASQDEFCEAFNGLVDEVMGAGISDPSAMVRAVKEWASDMEELGTPAEMPDDAQRGFELFVDKAADLDEDMGLEDLQNLGSELSEEDQADGQSFTGWTQENCPLED
jgi:hypothetical protein